MAINLYGGLMGHGKSYSAVVLLVKNYANGRSIATNIEGLNVENIKAYAMQKYDKKEEELGTIRIINDDDIKQKNFFPYEEIGTDGQLKVIEGICKSGEMIFIDEAWKHWQKTEKVLKEHDTFFRKMRHFVNEKGHTSDLILITQDHTQLSTGLKNLIEMMFLTKKLKSLGSIGENKFTLTIFEGNKNTRSSIIGHGVHIYDKDIFPLYKSYSQANAKEVLIDDRSNYFKGAYFKYSMIIAIVFILLCSWYLVHYYNGLQEKSLAQSQKKEKKTETGKAPISSDTQKQVPVSSSNISTKMQIVGAIISDNRFMVFVKENERTRLVNNPKCNGSGTFMICEIDNEKVSYYK